MDIKNEVNALYEQYPYPSLPITKKSDFFSGGHGKVMKRILSTIPSADFKGKSVLDAGCGTGEKSVYFALLGADVTAFDYSTASLKRAKQLAEKFGVHINFQHDDIIDPKINKKFDFILCLGVLHHTENPYKGFVNLTKLLKPNGCIVIGLYNKYGRLKHRIRRKIIQLKSKGKLEKKIELAKEGYRDKQLNETSLAYIADKYAHPYESYHTVGEVKKWFKRNGITPTGVHPAGSQLRWLVHGNEFFIVGGKSA